MKWNGKGCLRGTKTRKQYHVGDTVPPEDVSKDRLEELRANVSLVDVMPSDQVEANKEEASKKKPGPKPKSTTAKPAAKPADAGTGTGPKTDGE